MRARYTLLASALLVSFASRGEAQASESTARTIYIENKIEEHTIYLAPGKAATLAYHNPIIETSWPEDWVVKPKLHRGSDIVKFFAPKNATPDQLVGHVVIITRLHTTLFNVVAASTAQKPPDGAIDIDDSKLLNAMSKQIMAVKDREIAELKREVVETKRSNEQVTRQRVEEAVVRTVHEGYEARPIKMGACDGRGAVICGLTWGKLGDNGLFRFAINNSGHLALDVTRAELFDRHGLENRAGAIYIEGNQDDLPPGVLARIPPLTRVEASLIVHNPESVGDMVRLVIHGPSRMLPAIEWIELQPRAEPEREKSISITAGYGVAWLSDGMGMSQSDPTALRVLGARIARAFTEYIHVEGQLAVAKSGDARFEDVSFNDMTGDLTHSATLGRAQLGGLLRWGERYQPTFRVGVGAQGTSYDSRFSAGGASMDGPDISFELSVFFAVSAGIDVRLGEDIMAGFELSVQSPVGTQPSDLFGRAIQGGVYLGYAWTR